MKEKIKTFLFTGLLDAGKTTYIQDTLRTDYFYRHGRTLLLSFESGEEEYDIPELQKRRTDVAYYEGEGGKDITAFCLSAVETFRPDRIYVEDNLMMDGLVSFFPPCMEMQAKTALIDAQTLPLYFRNMRQKIRDAVLGSSLVIFNRAEKKEDLQEFGNDFRLMEPKTAYLWESPQGYHEKAFGVFLPYDPEQSHLVIGDDGYAAFFLDSLDRPERYAGKTVELTGQVRWEEGGGDVFRIGRLVMTCCPADMQFLSFACRNSGNITPSENARIHLRAVCTMAADEYGRRRLLLEPLP